jgi:aldose 1-epimerase
MNRLLTVGLSLGILFVVVSCQSQKTESKMVEKKLFGKLDDGKEVYSFTLTNNNKAVAEIIEYGATVTSLMMPDKNGKIEDIVLGYDNVSDYAKGTSYFGAIVGRYGNRIGKGKFTLDGKEYKLAVNNGENHLHGGILGYNKVLWNAEVLEKKEGPAVKFTYISKDGEEGYPGTVKLEVVYTLTNNNELSVEYSATTDKPTVFNPTHHSYFNLSGNFENTILDNELMIDADTYTPVDAGLITTGKLDKVENTPMDFRKPVKIGAGIDKDFEQLKFGKGYDHNWVLNNYNKQVRKVAELYEPKSGRLMEVSTDQPGIQFYSGNFLDGTAKGKKGILYKFRTGLCLETQHFPDSPNKPDFPTVRLNPGETYKHTTIYKFSTK